MIRRCDYSKQYNNVYFDGDAERVRNIIVCKDMKDLLKEFVKVFPNYKLYDKSNKRIEVFPDLT